MKYCEEYQALISAAVDNALTADERKKLMDHLAECPGCREVYTQMMAMHDAFEDWEEELPGDLTGDVMAKIRKEKALTKSRRRSWLPLVAAAACCALVFIGYQGIQTETNTADFAAMDSNAKAAVTESVADDAAGRAVETDDSAEESPDIVTYTASMEDIITGESEEQLLEGVLTYFHSAPEAKDPSAAEDPIPNAVDAARAQQTLLIITSSDASLPEWMAEYTTQQSYSSEEDDTTAWLITEAECSALIEWLTTEDLEWTQYLVELPTEAEEDLVCVVYLPS